MQGAKMAVKDRLSPESSYFSGTEGADFDLTYPGQSAHRRRHKRSQQAVSTGAGGAYADTFMSVT